MLVELSPPHCFCAKAASASTASADTQSRLLRSERSPDQPTHSPSQTAWCEWGTFTGPDFAPTPSRTLGLAAASAISQYAPARSNKPGTIGTPTGSIVGNLTGVLASHIAVMPRAVTGLSVPARKRPHHGGSTSQHAFPAKSTSALSAAMPPTAASFIDQLHLLWWPIAALSRQP